MSMFDERLDALRGKVIKAREMKRQDWIWFKWENVQEFGEEEPKYLFCGIRPIEEATEAARQFDTWL